MRAEGEVSRASRDTLLLVAASVMLVVGALTYEHILPPSIVKYLVAAVVACVAGLWVFAFPTYGLFLAVFYIYAGIGYYFNVHAGYPLVVISAVAAMMRLLGGDPLRVPSPGFNWSVAVFTLFALTSTLWAQSPEQCYYGMSLWVKSLLLVFLVVQLLRTPRDVERFAIVMFLAAVTSVLLGFANIVFGWVQEESLLVEYGWIRFTATHGDPNEAAVVLASTIPIGAYLLRRHKAWTRRAATIAGILLLTFAVFSTLSRAAIFPLGFVILVIIVRDLRRHAIVPLLLGAALVVLLVPPIYWKRLLSLEQLMSGAVGDFSLLMRFKAMQTAWHMFLAHPIAGVGLENFLVRSAPDLFRRMPPHNMLLDLLAGLGIIGFSAYAMIFGTAFGHFRAAIKARWSAGQEWMRHLSFYLLVSVGATIIGGIFLSFWYAYIIWLPVAAGLAAGRLARAGTERGEAPEQ